jgi:glycosyltransferase involved in cell wall biosynthesis
LPALRHKYLDTVSHAFLSSLHALFARYDAVLFCNAANAVFLLLPRMLGTPVAINVDGLEWNRKKWSRLGKWYYRLSARVAARLADLVVTDARVIESYYQGAFGRPSVVIPYGTTTEKAVTDEALKRFSLEAGRYFLYVSRFEPENNAHRVLEAFEKVESDLRLVMVGDAPYSKDYISRLKQTQDERVVFTGYVFGQGYRELMSHSYCYVHATEVGGTHPALVEAMGMGNGVLVSDAPENREVAADSAIFYSLTRSEDLVEKMAFAISHPRELRRLAERARGRARTRYSWDQVVDAYESLFQSIKGKPSKERASPLGKEIGKEIGKEG